MRINDYLSSLDNTASTIISYFAAFFALVASLPLMQIGGAVLLIARLVVDVPPAYIKIKKYLKRKFK
jgi:hypothetical protein